MLSTSRTQRQNGWAIALALLDEHEEVLLQSLVTVETRETACQELAWTRAALSDAYHFAENLEPAPIGRVAAVLPSTLPIYSSFLFGLTALLHGNVVTCRPSKASRHIVRAFSDLVLEPAGLLLNLEEGSWGDFSQVAACSEAFVFAGSRSNADALVSDLPDRVKIIYQGPGVCAAVVGPEANLEIAAEAIIADRTFNGGQDCMSTERAYVHDSQADEFEDALVASSEKLICGDLNDVSTDLGRLLHGDVYKSVLASAQSDPHVRMIREGREIEVGTFELTLVEAGPENELVLSECYGPLLPVIRYSSIAELKRYLAMGDFALGLTVRGEPRLRLQELDFAHAAFEQSLYSFESALATFGGYRKTTFVRHAGEMRVGPIVLVDELSNR